LSINWQGIILLLGVFQTQSVLAVSANMSVSSCFEQAVSNKNSPTSKNVTFFIIQIVLKLRLHFRFRQIRLTLVFGGVGVFHPVVAGSLGIKLCATCFILANGFGIYNSNVWRFGI
jgi:hypothetical protein